MTLGDIYMMDFGVPYGSEPGYRRPVIIAQSKKDSNLSKDSVALVHQMIVVDKKRLFEKLSKVDSSVLSTIMNAEDYVLKQ